MSSSVIQRSYKVMDQARFSTSKYVGKDFYMTGDTPSADPLPPSQPNWLENVMGVPSRSFSVGGWKLCGLVIGKVGNWRGIPPWGVGLVIKPPGVPPGGRVGN